MKAIISSKTFKFLLLQSHTNTGTGFLVSLFINESALLAEYGRDSWFFFLNRCQFPKLFRPVSYPISAKNSCSLFCPFKVHTLNLHARLMEWQTLSNSDQCLYRDSCSSSSYIIFRQLIDITSSSSLKYTTLRIIVTHINNLNILAKVLWFNISCFVVQCFTQTYWSPWCCQHKVTALVFHAFVFWK